MRLLTVLLFFLLLQACSKDTELIAVKGNIMGTYYVVKVAGDIEQDKLFTLVQTRLEELNKVFSTYDKESELSKINQSEKVEHQLSSELMEVIQVAKHVSLQTSGYFDVTVGPLVNAWGFGPEGIKRRPQQKKIDELMTKVGHDKIELNGDMLKREAGVYIDLSAIAKGYAVDKIVELLKAHKFQAGLVEIGGEIRTFGRKSKDDPWQVGIEQPVESKAGVQRIFSLEDMAIATSGSYRNYRKYGDQVFSHTIDPTTGHPVTHKLISVSVLSDNCTLADAWATALLALGPEKGLTLANEKDISAYFMLKEKSEVYTKSSLGFKKYLKSTKAGGENQ